MSNKPIVLKLIYNRKEQLDTNGKALIQIRAYKDNQTFYISTGISVIPDHWDEGREKIINHSDNAKLNLRIQKTIRELQGLEQKYSYHNQDFGISELKSLWENKSIVGFISYIEDRVSKELNLFEKTRNKILRTVNKFRNYAKGEVYFSALNFKLPG